MHQQIKASPDDTAENVRTIVDALAAAGINIEAIAPDFDPPHVRVLVKHKQPKWDPDDQDDPFNRALVALTAARAWSRRRAVRGPRADAERTDGAQDRNGHARGQAA